MIIPRLPLVVLFALPLGFAAAAIADRQWAETMWLTNAGVALLAGLDLLLSWRVKIDVERLVPDVMSLGRRNSVRLRLRSRGARRLAIQVKDDVFDQCETEDLPITAQLRPGVAHEASYSVIPNHRGAYQLGGHTLRARSTLGLWMVQRHLSAEDRIKVYPDLQSLRVFELLARQDREHAFLRAQRLKGGESEFARLRDYTRDDEYRSIDWRATARRHRLTAREYQLESNQNLFFLLDAGRAMTARSGNLTLLDHALNATLMLSQVAVRNGDRVGMMGFEERVHSYVTPQSGGRATQRLIQAGYDLHPRLVESDYDRAFMELSLRLQKRSLVILLTQVLDEGVANTLLRRTRGLLPRHLPLILLFRDERLDQMMQQPSRRGVELYTRAAGAELLRWRSHFVQQLKAQGAMVLEATPKDLTPQLINRYLEIKARHLL
jgi:uncharacterized protein (DUF58 family)